MLSVQNGTIIHLKPIWELGQSFGRSWMARMARRLTVMVWSQLDAEGGKEDDDQQSDH